MSWQATPLPEGHGVQAGAGAGARWRDCSCLGWQDGLCLVQVLRGVLKCPRQPPTFIHCAHALGKGGEGGLRKNLYLTWNLHSKPQTYSSLSSTREQWNLKKKLTQRVSPYLAKEAETGRSLGRVGIGKRSSLTSEASPWLWAPAMPWTALTFCCPPHLDCLVLNGWPGEGPVEQAGIYLAASE